MSFTGVLRTARVIRGWQGRGGFPREGLAWEAKVLPRPPTFRPPVSQEGQRPEQAPTPTLGQLHRPDPSWLPRRGSVSRGVCGDGQRPPSLLTASSNQTPACWEASGRPCWPSPFPHG